MPHEPRGRTIRLTLRGTKKMISAPACSRTMGIDFLESLAPISYGDVPSLSPPVDRIMPNEGAVIMSPSESLYFWPNQCYLQLCAFHPVITCSKRFGIPKRVAHRAQGTKKIHSIQRRLVPSASPPPTPSAPLPPLRTKRTITLCQPRFGVGKKCHQLLD